MSKYKLIISALTVIGVCISSQSIMAAPSFYIQTYLNQFAQRNGLVGVALTINNKAYYYGYSNKQLAKAVTEHTEFGIGSITKTFVSVALLKGLININDKITKYFSQYPKLKHDTIKALMQMIAGFNDVSDAGLPLQHEDNK